MNPGDAIILHAHVAHSVGRNLTNRTRAALAHVYKGAHVLDAEPGEGNTRSWAELPITRGGCAATTITACAKCILHKLRGNC